jgi:PAS domain S-box-containing protein
VEISESVFHTGDRDFFCGIVRDISEQLQTDQTLRLRDSALSAIGTGVMITAVTGTDHPIIYCNPAFERISGYTSAEVLGRDGRFMQGDDTDQPGLQRIRSALAANREVHAVVRNYRKNGTMFWNKLLTTPFRDTSGKTTHFVCVIEDVTEQIRAEEDLRELSQQMAKIQEREHQRIAGELHDRLGQSLTTLSISLTAERNAWIASGQDNTTKRLNECLYVVEEMGCHIEDLMGEMHPPVLDDYGIVSALRCYAEHFERRTGIIVEVECGEEPERLSYDQESGLFRIVQEALANIVKHAEATSVRIGVENTAVGMRVIIRDDGKGFEMPRIERRRKRRHWGLVIMRERARALGGEFYADSVPGQGTRITVDVRVQPNDDITK